MKKISFVLFLSALIGFSVAAYAQMDKPDIEGRIADINYGKHQIVVRNILPMGPEKRLGDIRVLIKQGMINDYKLRDYVKVELSDDGKTASMIEIVKH